MNRIQCFFRKRKYKWRAWQVERYTISRFHINNWGAIPNQYGRRDGKIISIWKDKEMLYILREIPLPKRILHAFLSVLGLRKKT